MKTLFAALLLVLASSAHAQYRTQDRVHYVITFEDGADWVACARDVDHVSEPETFEFYPVIGVATATLDSSGLVAVRDMSCVKDIGISGHMGIRPRIGRGN